MHWEWLVPVLFLLFWIVSSLLQGAEKERARMNRPRPLPGGERPPATPRRPASDIDRFLEEVNRRRRQAAERRPVPSGRDRPPTATVGPAAPVARPRVSTRSTSGRQVVPPSGKISEAVPVTETTAAAEVLAVASVMHAPPLRNFPSAETTPPSSGSSVAGEPAALPPLVELLRAPDNLRTAVILHEIFSPPRCRRPALHS
jgi:hypothetical protein